MRLVIVVPILLLSIFSSSSFNPQVHADSNAPQVDTSTNIATSSGGSSNTITLSTTQKGELVLVWADLNGNFQISSISDTSNLVWVQRSTIGPVTNVGYSYEYFAFANSVLSSDVITVTALGSETNGVSIIAISLINAVPFPSNPFDAGPRVPSTTSGTFSVNAIGTITNSFTETLVVSFVSEFVGGGGILSSTPLPPLTSVLVGVSPSTFENIGVAIVGNLTTVGIQINAQWLIVPSVNWEMGLDVVKSPFSTQGGSNNNSPGLRSVQGPGGVAIPPQLADQNVLSLMGIISGIFLLSAIPRIQKEKKRKDSFI